MPGRDRRAKAGLVREARFASWTQRKECLCLAWSQEQLILCDQRCQQFLPTGLEKPVMSADMGRHPVPEAGMPTKRKRTATFPSPPLDGLLFQVHSCHCRDARHPTLWPQNVAIQGILCSPCYPHPRPFAQFGAVWFQPTFPASPLATAAADDSLM